MKFAFLAASALALSVPAFAQDTTTTTPPPAGQDTMTTQDPSAQDPSMQNPTAQDPSMQTPPATTADPATQDPAMQTPPATDPAMQTPPAGDPSMQTQGTMGTTTGTMTQGGYAPSTPPTTGAPGGQVVFRPSAPVAQAFPPPAPKESYPTCSRTVTDGCRNPGGR